MATIKVKTTASAAPATLGYGELGIASNELYFGNSSNAPVQISKVGHTHDASAITSGTLADARIPNLNASKITTGTFSADRIPSTLNITSSRGFYLSANGIPTNNLGSPSLAEMGLIQEQFDNKTAFFNINNLWAETSTDGINWTDFSLTDTQKRNLVGGDSGTNISIPNGTAYFRFRLRATSYVYTNALYCYWSSNGHTTQVQVYKKHDSGSYTQQTNSTASVGSWPGHLFLPFPTIPWHPTATLGSHFHEIFFVFIPNWNVGYPSNDIAIYKLQVWGGYPAGKRNVFSTDAFGAVNFPGTIRSNSVDVVLTNDARLTDARTPTAHTQATLNGTNVNLPSFFAPTTGATVGNYPLLSGGTNAAPVWGSTVLGSAAYEAFAEAATANTLVKRTSANYIYGGYFNSNRGNETSAAASYIYDTGDGWMRKKTLANATAEIVTSASVTTALGYTPYSNTNPSGYITGINSSMVTTALGFTPYSNTNPSGFTANTITMNGAANANPTFFAPTTSATTGYLLKATTGDNAPTWALLTSAEVTTALGFTPANSSSLANYLLLSGSNTMSGAIKSRPGNSVALFDFEGKNSSGQVTNNIKFGSAQGLGIAGATDQYEVGFLITSSGNPRKFFIKTSAGGAQLEVDYVNASQYKIGDVRKDTNWDTGYSYSQTGHLPLAGGTMSSTTSHINMNGSNITNANLVSISSCEMKYDSTSKSLKFSFV